MFFRIKFQFSSVVSSPIGSTDDSAEIICFFFVFFLFFFCKEATESSSGMGRCVDCLISRQQFHSHRVVVHSPRCPEDGCREALAACNMPKPWKFLSPSSCQKRFMQDHKEVDPTPYLVVRFLRRRGGEVASGTWFRKPGFWKRNEHAVAAQIHPRATSHHHHHYQFLFRISKQGKCFRAIDEDGGCCSA